MGPLVRFAVMLLVAKSVHHGYCQSATSALGSDKMVPRDIQGPTTAVQPRTRSPRTAVQPRTRSPRTAVQPRTRSPRPAVQPQTGSPTTAAQPRTGSPTREDFREVVARVVSRQREGMLHWVLVAGGAGLGAITVLSLLTVLLHKLYRRSQTVDMRHKHSTSQANGPHKHKALAGGQKTTALAETDKNYCNMSSLPVPKPRVADSVLSWGSEFELAGDLTENIYSNDYKKPPRDDCKKPPRDDCKNPPRDDCKKGSSKPANLDIYINVPAL